MEENKRVIILVAIALILAATAITLNIMSSKEVPTSQPSSEGQPSGGVVGIDVQPPMIEDKLTSNQTPQQ